MAAHEESPDETVRMRAMHAEAPSAETARATPLSFDTVLPLNPFAEMAPDVGLLKAVMKRQAEGGGAATLGDLARAMLERPDMTTERGADDESREKEIERISKSGLAAVFAGAVPFATAVAELARAVADAPRRDPEIAELKATVTKQSAEIRTLKARVTRGFAAREAPAKKAAPAARTKPAKALRAATKARKAGTKPSSRRKPNK